MRATAPIGLAALFLILSLACGGGGGGSSAPAGGSSNPPPAPTLVSLAVTPANPTVVKGFTRQLTATGTYSDSTTRDLTATVTWTSGTPSVASVTSGGLATGLAAGTSLITATQGTLAGSTTLTITAPQMPTLTGITITPASPSLAKGGTRQFTASGAYSDGTSQDVTASVTWTSGTPSVASITSGGLATGLASGTSLITAAQGTVSATTTLTVTTPTLTGLSITPAQAVVATGGSYTFKANGTFSDGTTSTVAAAWTSANPAIATVGASTGVVTGGTTYGTTTITAAAGTFTATASVINDFPTPTKLDITPASPTVNVGSTAKLSAMVTWSDGTTTDGSGPASWSTSAPTIATVGSGGTVTGVAAGTTTIGAAYTSVSGGGQTRIVNGSTTLNVVASPLVSLAVTPAASTLNVNGSVSLTATGTYGDGHTALLTAASSWSSSNTAVATVDMTGVVIARSAGTATITAKNGTITGTASITVNATATLTSITLAPLNQTLAVGATSQYSAIGNYSNGVSSQLNTGVTWTTSPAGVATVDAWGLVTAVAAGSTTVTASSAGVTASTTLTVSAPAPTFDPRLVGNWKWIGFPDSNGNNYGSFYTFNANGTFTYDLMYLGSGVGCIAYVKVVAHHEGTYSSLGSLDSLTTPGKIVFTCTAHGTGYWNCSASTTGGASSQTGWTGTNPHFHWAAFTSGYLRTNHADDFLATGNIDHVKY